MKNLSELASKMFSTRGFPDPLATNKDTPEFGLIAGKGIENEWFRRHRNADSRYYDNQHKFHLKRLYARAEQPIGKYKNEMAVNGDLSYLNLDWTPVSILPKFVDIVVNGISNRLFTINAHAVDKLATERKSRYIMEMEKDMVAKEMLMEAKESLGVDGFVNNPKDLPESSEELQVHMQLNFKEGVEVAEEEAINYIFKKNDFIEVKTRFDYDVMVLGVGAMKHSFNTSDGATIEWVDPANLVYSVSDDPYRKDCYYFGEVKKLPVQELRKINPELTTEELQTARDISSDWDLYHSVKTSVKSDFDNHTCNVLFFNYKATREVVYKKKTLSSGKVSMIKKEEGWSPDPEDMELRGYERVSKYEDVWYEGVLILGSNMLIKWNVVENMIRDNSSNKVIPNYVVCAPRVYDDVTESLLGRMIPFADQIQLVSLKLQQVSARVVPDGVFIDVDGLNEIDLGDGLKYDPKRALQLFFQTGSVVGRSQTGDGGLNHGKIPIQELSNSSGRAKIEALIGLYDKYLQMIRDVTGLNEARDASTPDSKTLVGVQKLAALNSNTATRHIQEAGIYATKKIAEAISYRISDMLKYSDFKEELVEAIGAANVSILDEIDNIPLHLFGIFIEVEPDAQEREYLEQNIQEALRQNLIYLDDAAEIREIKNVKLANKVMKIRRQQKVKAEQEAKLEALREQSKGQTETAQAQSDAKIAEINAKADADIRKDTNLKDLEDRNQENDVDRKEYLMGIEFDLKAFLEGIQASHKDVLSDSDARRKAAIQKQTATQQSAIEAQKAETGSNAPINFESENDNLQKTDLAQFEPR